MLESGFILLLSFVVAFFALPIIIRLADRLKLYDMPEKRKQHRANVSALGGIAIVGGLFFGVLIFIDPIDMPEYKYILSTVGLAFMIGLRDDLNSIKPWLKLLSQLSVAAILVFLTEIQLTSLFGLFGIEHLGPLPGKLLAIAIIVLAMNAINFIDGLDLLATMISLSALSFLGYWYINQEMFPWAGFAFGALGSLLAFGLFNRPDARIFMGDNGALSLGFLIGLLMIKFLVPGTAGQSNIFIPAVAYSVLAIPFSDMLRVVVIRLLNKRRPYKADRLHIHFLLQSIQWKTWKIVSWLTLVNILSIVFAIIVTPWIPWPELNMILVIFFPIALFYMPYALHKKGDLLHI